VAGGTHPTHNFWMQTAIVTQMVSEQIKLPAKWDELVAIAERDLGYEPEA